MTEPRVVAADLANVAYLGDLLRAATAGIAETGLTGARQRQYTYIQLQALVLDLIEYAKEPLRELRRELTIAEANVRNDPSNDNLVTAAAEICRKIREMVEAQTA